MGRSTGLLKGRIPSIRQCPTLLIWENIIMMNRQREIIDKILEKSAPWDLDKKFSLRISTFDIGYELIDLINYDESAVEAIEEYEKELYRKAEALQQLRHSIIDYLSITRLMGNK